MLSVSIPPSVTDPTAISKELVDELAQQVRGPVVTRANPEYVTCALSIPRVPAIQSTRDTHCPCSYFLNFYLTLLSALLSRAPFCFHIGSELINFFSLCYSLQVFPALPHLQR